VGTAVAAGGSWLNWAYFYYGVVGDHLIITEGWLVKKRRSIPLARVQGVDIRADLISRILGLANVVVQTAGGGGGEAEATIGSIPLSAAETLRAQLISGRAREAATAAAVDGAAGGVAGKQVASDAGSTAAAASNDPVGRLSDFRGVLGGAQPPETETVFEHSISLSWLFVAALTSNGPVIAFFAAIGFAAQAFEMFGADPFDAATSAARSLAFPVLLITGLGAFIVVVGAAVATSVARDFGFRVRRAGRRLETESGLLERRMTSVPVRRIQAVIVESTPLRRLFMLSSVRVNTAGFGRSEEQQSTTAASLIPILRSKELRPLLHRLLPEAEQFPQARSLPARALRFYVLLPSVTAVFAALVLVGGPLAANLLLQFSEALVLATPLIMALSVTLAAGFVATSRFLAWRVAGFGVDTHSIAVNYGMLGRYRARIARSRIQSLSVRQSPFQRRAGLATLHLATVSGSSQTVFRVRHMTVGDAAAIERWYSPGPVPAGNAADAAGSTLNPAR
jgi:putative membrane protein